MTDRAVPALPSRDLDASRAARCASGLPIGYLVDLDGTQLHLVEDAG